MTAAVQYTSGGGVARITFDNQPKRNALSWQMWSDLPGAVARACDDPAVRLICVSGAGDAAFSAGADLSDMGAGDMDAFNRTVDTGMRALADASKPTLAVVRGICVGGGMLLAMYCDLRVAVAGARFRIPAGVLGLGFSYEHVQDLVLRLGFAATADILFTSRMIDAEQAKALGIVQSVFPAETAAKDIAEIEAPIAASAPLTLIAIKRALIELKKPRADRDVAAADELVARCFASQDCKEGAAAFRERRTPVFQGR